MKNLRFILALAFLVPAFGQLPKNVQKVPGTNAITEDLVIPSGRNFSLETALAWADDVRQTFNPGAINAGFNPGAHTANPSSPTNGDLYYNSTANELRARINGAWVSLGGGGGGGIAGSTGAADNTLLRSDGTGGATLQASNVTLADSGTTFVFSGAAGLQAGGSNQNITLTPSGTGTNVISGGLRSGIASSSVIGTTFEFYGATDSTTSYGLRRASADVAAPFIAFSKSRGSIASPSAILSGDALGGIYGGGYDGTSHADYQSLVQLEATQNWSNSARGTAISFGTTPNNSTTRSTRMKLDNDGALYFGGDSTTGAHADGRIKIFGTSDTTASQALYRASSDINSPVIMGLKARNTQASPQPPQANDLLFAVQGGGYGSTTWRSYTIRMAFRATQTWSDTALGNEILFSTTPNNSQTRADAVAIRQDQSLEALAGLYVSGGDVKFDKTITAGGTTGAQTINKNAGSVNFAPAATNLVVTNSRVTTSSLVICFPLTNDSALKSVVAVPAAGSFTIYANAGAAAETRVGFIVIN